MIKIGSYDYKNLIRSYLIQDHITAKTAQNRMSYYTNTLYSYNTKMAFLNTIKNTLYINYDILSISNTTNRHVKLLKDINNNKFEIFEVPLNFDKIQNLNFLWEKVISLIEKHKHSRKYKDIIKLNIKKAIYTAKQYAVIHNLASDIPEPIMKELFIKKLI